MRIIKLLLKIFFLILTTLLVFYDRDLVFENVNKIVIYTSISVFLFFIFLKIYNDFIHLIFTNLIKFFEMIGKYYVKKKKISIVMFIIRLNYLFFKLQQLLRKRNTSFNKSKEDLLWKEISRGLLSQKIFKFLMSFPVLLSFLLVLLSLDKFYIFKEYIEVLKFFQGIEFDISDIVLRMPGVLAIITLIPIIFFFYFYNQTREVRKIINKYNSKYFEKVVLLHQELLYWIDNNIYDISKNFEYVIKNQSQIRDMILEKEIKDYNKLNNIDGIKSNLDLYFLPKQLSYCDLKNMERIFEDLLSENLIEFTIIFSYKKYDIAHFYVWCVNSLKTVKKIENSFYTEKGIESKLEDISEPFISLDVNTIEERKKKLDDYLSSDIYYKLELLYKLNRFRFSLIKYLYFSKYEKLILKAFNKDK